MPLPGLGRMLFDEGGDISLGASTDDLVYHDAVLKKEEGRDGRDAKVLRQGRVAIHVHFANLDRCPHFGGKLIEDRA